jgi:hypothetical protein
METSHVLQMSNHNHHPLPVDLSFWSANGPLAAWTAFSEIMARAKMTEEEEDIVCLKR